MASQSPNPGPQATRLASPDQLDAVTGVHLMQGIGHRPAQGFWTEAWGQVIRRPGAILGLAWLSVVVFFAIFAPVLASGHPIFLRDLGQGGAISSPMLRHLTGADVLLLLGGLAGGPLLALPRRLLFGWGRQSRLAYVFVAGLASGLVLMLSTGVRSAFEGGVFGSDGVEFSRQIAFPWLVATAVTLAVLAGALWMPFFERWSRRVLALAPVGLVTLVAIATTWNPPIERFDYREREARGEISAVYTIVPFSPTQGSTALDLREPDASPMSAIVDGLVREVARAKGIGGFSDDPRWQVRRSAQGVAMADVPLDDEIAGKLAEQLRFNERQLPSPRESITADFEAARGGELATLYDLVAWLTDMSPAEFEMGTDSNGRDVLSQMMHACRLSISIGLVSTGIAVLIGVTMGALMGYFGGWVDMLLYRVVEIFMAVPVLFLLIVAAGVLPRNTYVMMIIIGCVTWTGAARFIRAEFFRLRDQDFVQSARAVGLPLRSILFKHMLPNGVTPVLVESSFAIAAAILAEATLSYLGLGPANQASWGRLLSDATNQVGDFVWWLAIYPGMAIFLTVLAYNLIGEALRDAIDPKLKKARV